MRLTMLSNFQTLHVFHPEYHLFLISRHGLVWTRIRLATTRLGPQDQSYGASLYEGEVCPSKLQYFMTKTIAAKDTTCLRRRRVRIKCMSMNKCSIHCTSISQKIGLAQEVPYSSRTCSVNIRKYRQQVARCSPIQQSFWEVGCLQKTHCFFRSTQQKCSISVRYEVCLFAFFSKIQDPLRRSSLNIESLCVQRSVSPKGYLYPF